MMETRESSQEDKMALVLWGYYLRNNNDLPRIDQGHSVSMVAKEVKNT
jgi:hypothetical protein